MLDKPDDLPAVLNAILTSKGTPVMSDTLDCILWRLEHRTCGGCPYELGCCKNLILQLLFIIAPPDLPDLIDKIMSAESIEEIKKEVEK